MIGLWFAFYKVTLLDNALFFAFQHQSQVVVLILHSPISILNGCHNVTNNCCISFYCGTWVSNNCGNSQCDVYFKPLQPLIQLFMLSARSHLWRVLRERGKSGRRARGYRRPGPRARTNVGCGRIREFGLQQLFFTLKNMSEISTTFPKVFYIWKIVRTLTYLLMCACTIVGQLKL